MSPISSEELEHIENTWLDTAYEAALIETGDDLRPIADAPKWMEKLFGSAPETTAGRLSHSNGHSATAAAPARDAPSIIPVYQSEEDEELPELDENPTEDELMNYAAAHPVVKKALRIFRAKVVEVRKI